MKAHKSINLDIVLAQRLETHAKAHGISFSSMTERAVAFALANPDFNAGVSTPITTEQAGFTPHTIAQAATTETEEVERKFFDA